MLQFFWWRFAWKFLHLPISTESNLRCDWRVGLKERRSDKYQRNWAINVFLLGIHKKRWTFISYNLLELMENWAGLCILRAFLYGREWRKIFYSVSGVKRGAPGVNKFERQYFCNIKRFNVSKFPLRCQRNLPVFNARTLWREEYVTC